MRSQYCPYSWEESRDTDKAFAVTRDLEWDCRHRRGGVHFLTCYLGRRAEPPSGLKLTELEKSLKFECEFQIFKRFPPPPVKFTSVFSRGLTPFFSQS